MANGEMLYPWEYSDSRILTEQERQSLGQLLYYALLDIRILGWEGKAEQAADIADTFHNMVNLLWSDRFSFSGLQLYVEAYEEKYGITKYSQHLEQLNLIDSKVKKQATTLYAPQEGYSSDISFDVSIDELAVMIAVCTSLIHEGKSPDEISALSPDAFVEVMRTQKHEGIDTKALLSKFNDLPKDCYCRFIQRMASRLRNNSKS